LRSIHVTLNKHDWKRKSERSNEEKTERSDDKTAVEQ